MNHPYLSNDNVVSEYVYREPLDWPSWNYYSVFIVCPFDASEIVDELLEKIALDFNNCPLPLNDDDSFSSNGLISFNIGLPGDNPENAGDFLEESLYDFDIQSMVLVNQDTTTKFKFSSHTWSLLDMLQPND